MRGALSVGRFGTGVVHGRLPASVGDDVPSVCAANEGLEMEPLRIRGVRRPHTCWSGFDQAAVDRVAGELGRGREEARLCEVR